ncbi:MAG: LPS assembly protein LptD [Legionellaceae bacterium]|nr:LPS assembly protein LptD [Legionellaceae bacterium]
MAAEVDPSAQSAPEPLYACVYAWPHTPDAKTREAVAQCLGWQPGGGICQGSYVGHPLPPLPGEDWVSLKAQQVSLAQAGKSVVSGQVEIQQADQVISAPVAYVYREGSQGKITKIEFTQGLIDESPNWRIVARHAVMRPTESSGEIWQAVYRFSSAHPQYGALLPAWGRTSYMKRLPNKDTYLKQATYTYCAPQDNAWQINADSLYLDHATETGTAKHATIRVKDIPIMYVPYLSFPTSSRRRSGFLLPIKGYSNVGGFEFSLPYYLNLAPNYDATLAPHWYSRRGVMLDSEFRYLTPRSRGVFTGHILSHDSAYSNFLQQKKAKYPRLEGKSTDRWSLNWGHRAFWGPSWDMAVITHAVSDDYYLQDFSSNLAVVTERQLERSVQINYHDPHWAVSGLAQGFQTLHPVDETPVSDVYQRLPHFTAQGYYNQLPGHSRLNMLGVADNFHWPTRLSGNMDAQRLYANPVWSIPLEAPYGYITPAAEWVGSQYYLQMQPGNLPADAMSLNLSRLSVDSGVYFDRFFSFMHHDFHQTLEPHLYYLRVPYLDQTPFPVFDSGYMIFTTDQLFRNNRFSGFDRTGDANQLAYALTSRLLSSDTGEERLLLTVGQIRYFADRLVGICYNPYGACVDNPLTLGYLSPTYGYSPVASRLSYHINGHWDTTADYVWDPSTRKTNNTQLNLRYQPKLNTVLNFGYTYLVNGDITQVGDPQPLHQASASVATPLTERWSAVGAYGYNISKGYSMLSLLGLQYDSCCWAFRLMGGQTFQSLDNGGAPQYNNNVYVQLLLKGLGSVGSSDAGRALQTFIPGYVDPFRQ